MHLALKYDLSSGIRMLIFKKALAGLHFIIDVPQCCMLVFFSQPNQLLQHMHSA